MVVLLIISLTQYLLKFSFGACLCHSCKLNFEYVKCLLCFMTHPPLSLLRKLFSLIFILFLLPHAYDCMVLSLLHTKILLILCIRSYLWEGRPLGFCLPCTFFVVFGNSHFPISLFLLTRRPRASCHANPRKHGSFSCFSLDQYGKTYGSYLCCLWAGKYCKRWEELSR